MEASLRAVQDAAVQNLIRGEAAQAVADLSSTIDASGGSFLHGFLNNSENPGSTYLTVNQTPEPASLLLILAASVALAASPSHRPP